MPGALWHHEGLDELRLEQHPSTSCGGGGRRSGGLSCEDPTRPASWSLARGAEGLCAGRPLQTLCPDGVGSRRSSRPSALRGRRWSSPRPTRAGRSSRHAAPDVTHHEGRMVRANAASTSAPSRWPASTSRAGSTMSAAMLPLKTRCAASTRHRLPPSGLARPRRCSGLGIDPPAGQAPRTGGGAEHQPLRRRAHPTAGRRLDLDPLRPATAVRRLLPAGAAVAVFGHSRSVLRKTATLESGWSALLDIQLPGPPGHGYVV